MSSNHRMNRFSAVASLTLVGLLALGCTRDPNVRKVKYLNSGKAYAAQGKEKEAAIQFENAIKIDSHYAPAHFELAKVYLKLGVPMGAYTELMRTVASDPKNVQARLDLGQMLLAGHQYPRALEQANAILAIDPKNADAYGLKSAIAIANNDRQEALKDIQQALAIEPNRAGFHAQLGLIQGANPADAKEAEEQVRDAVKLDPKSAPAHLLLSAMLQRKGDAAGALAEAQAATQADPKNIRAWVALAALEFRAGDKAKADSTLMQATDQLHDTNDGAALLYNFYRQTGQLGQATGVYANLVNKYPKSVPLKLVYAQVLSDTGNFGKVQQIVDELNKTNASDPEVEALNGMLLLRAGKTNDAVTLLQKGAKNAPDNLVVKFWLGEALKAKGDIPGAEQNFRAVTQANPGNLLAEKELAGVAAQTHDNALLQQVSGTLITRFPNLPDGYVWRAVAEGDQKQIDKAEADLQTALKMDPKNSSALVMLGEIRFQQKRYPEGSQMLEQAINEDPHQLPALQILVSYYMFQKQPDKALSLVQQQIAKNPNDSQLYDELAQVQLANNDVKGAVSSTEKAMQLNPSDPAALMIYARAATVGGFENTAIAKWQGWASAHPTDARAPLMMGTLEEARGNYNGAIDDYKKVLAIQPDQAVAENNLAFLMLQQGQDVDQALSYAQSARRAMPHSPNTADTLAWAYYSKGVYSSARDLLEDAGKSDPTNPSIQFHLGMVYSKLGNKEAAVEHLKKAAVLAPASQSGKDAAKELSTLGA